MSGQIGEWDGIEPPGRVAHGALGQVYPVPLVGVIDAVAADLLLQLVDEFDLAHGAPAGRGVLGVGEHVALVGQPLEVRLGRIDDALEHLLQVGQLILSQLRCQARLHR